MTRRGFFRLALGAPIAAKLLPSATDSGLDVAALQETVYKLMRARMGKLDVIEIITDDDGLRSMFSLVEGDPQRIEEMIAEIHRREPIIPVAE